MALQGHQLGRDKLCCFICEDLIKNPVTIPCGHSYCLSCICRCWDEEEQKNIYSCPHCRKTFKPRPALVISTVLAELLEELKKKKKKTEPQAGPSDHCDAGPGDVGCSPTGRKRKSMKSCLQCLVSFCEQHLQPHSEVPSKKTKLIEASKLQENICSQHDMVMEIFCLTDQQVICSLCLNDEHKEHDIVSAAAEMSKKKKELGVSRQNIQQRIQNKEKDVKVLQQEVEAINLSADKAVRESESTCTELFNLIEKRSSDVNQKIKSRQEYEVSRVKRFQEMLQKDISYLRRKDTELEKLSQTDDQIKFLQAYPSLSNLRDAKKPFRVNKGPVRYFEDVTAAVSEARGKVLESLNKEWMKISEKVPEVDVKLLPDPQTKADISQYTGPKEILKVDPNTASMQIQLSEDNRKATSVKEPQSYDPHVDRFMERCQFLCGKLPNRCYWEGEVLGFGVSVAVAYRDVPRIGKKSAFGDNDKSWALEISKTICNFKHNGEKKTIPVPQSSRIGVFLDQKAGVLSFYSVSETITLLLHRVYTKFTQPLYAGFGVYYYGASATFCDIKVEPLSSEVSEN